MITLQDLFENPDLLKDMPGDTCCSCGERLSTTITGKRQTAEGLSCDDCYFGKLGDEIEQYPLGKS